MVATENTFLEKTSFSLSLSLSCLLQGFLQLDEVGGQHDPHLRIIGGHEILEGHTIHMFHIKGKNSHMF